MAAADDYSVEPFLGAVQSGARSQDISAQLEARLNQSTQTHGQVLLVSTVSVRVEPGCLGRLLGKKSAWTRHDQVVFGPLSSISDSTEVEITSRCSSAAETAPEADRADTTSTLGPRAMPLS